MKPGLLLGILLVALGFIAIAYQGISYTTRQKLVDLGPIEATKKEKKTIPLSPVLGGVAIAGGIALLIATGKGQ